MGYFYGNRHVTVVNGATDRKTERRLSKIYNEWQCKRQICLIDCPIMHASILSDFIDVMSAPRILSTSSLHNNKTVFSFPSIQRRVIALCLVWAPPEKSNTSINQRFQRVPTPSQSLNNYSTNTILRENTRFNEICLIPCSRKKKILFNQESYKGYKLIQRSN